MALAVIMIRTAWSNVARALLLPFNDDLWRRERPQGQGQTRAWRYGEGVALSAVAVRGMRAGYGSLVVLQDWT